MTRTTLTALTLAATMTACAHETPAPPQPKGPTTVQRTLADVGLDIKAMDRTVDPCQDFYRYACGGWIKSTPIPADKPAWTRSFSEIHDRNEEFLHQTLEKARQAENPDEVTKKIGGFYNSCMDEEGVEKTGLSPVEKYLQIVRKVKDRKSLFNAIFELHKAQFWVLFDIEATQDGKDATKTIAALDQNGLGLPNKNFYLDNDDHSKDIRSFYEGHVTRMITLGGEKEKAAKAASGEVLALETALAKISKSPVERRDPQGMYNKVDLDGLKKLTPEFPWDDYLKALGHPDITEISVTSKPYFSGLSEILTKTKPTVWRSYLEWQVLHHSAPFLTKALVDENFALGKKLTGQDQLAVRWKRCVQATDGALGELLGQSFVKEKFGGDSKTANETMVSEIRDAFGHNLAALDWMDDATRAKAAEKLKAVSFLIGYPDKWKAYDYPVDPKNYGANVFASSAYELNRDLTKIGKPVDRGEWDMTPPTVNAYYDPTKNQMVFPAGILQSPFFSPTASVAVNMGGMGMVVGHELTHGFDDEGSQFDAVGNLSNWWNDDVNKKFTAKGQCIADQYSAYAPFPDAHVNGKLTEGENIADNGGMKLAFHAYRNMRAHADEKIVANGFTEDQQFFLAIGQLWCTNAKEPYLRTLVRTNPHSPPEFRVNGPLSNLPEFSEAFSCKVGTPMHPAKSCNVW